MYTRGRLLRWEFRRSVSRLTASSRGGGYTTLREKVSEETGKRVLAELGLLGKGKLGGGGPAARNIWDGELDVSQWVPREEW